MNQRNFIPLERCRPLDSSPILPGQAHEHGIFCLKCDDDTVRCVILLSHADLLCGILESKGAYFVEHPVVEKEVDSATSCRLLSRRALDAEAVLGTHVITPKHIIN